MQAYLDYLKQLQVKYTEEAEKPIDRLSQFLSNKGISIELALNIRVTERERSSMNEFNDLSGVGNLNSGLMKEKKALRNKKKHMAAYSFFTGGDSGEELHEPYFAGSLVSDRASEEQPVPEPNENLNSERRPLNLEKESSLLKVQKKKTLPFNIRDGKSPFNLKEEISERSQTPLLEVDNISVNKSKNRSRLSKGKKGFDIEFETELENFRKKPQLSQAEYDRELRNMQQFLDKGTHSDSNRF